MSMANGAADIAADDPSLYNQDATDSSSNQKGVPVPWWTGLDWRPLTWIVPDTIDATGKPGLTGTTIKKKKHGVSIKYGKKYRANVAGIAGLGVIDSIHAIEINKAIVWPASGVPDEHGLRRDDGAAHTAGNPDSPYWRATIALRQDAINSQFRLYWGRADQPADNTVLAKWAALGYEHPAYRGQVLCCMENWYFGRNCTNVPNTRILVRRSPQPEVGNFPTTWNPRGESLPAAILELLTNKIYGAGIPPEHFTPAQWEALSAAVMADIGHHSPQLLRAEPVTDTMKKLLSYYDGYLTIRGSTITPGRYPHDAVKVAPRASITLYDLTDKPRLSLTPAAQAVNTVTVTCRDRAAKLVESTVTARDTSAIAARDGGEIAATLDMPAITDLVMAEQYAARAAATATSASATWTIELPPARAILTSGAQALPGHNADFTYPPLGLFEKYCRITSRTDTPGGKTSLTLEAEHGFFGALPPIPPPAPPPVFAQKIPDPVTAARIIELPRTDFSPTAPATIAFLIRRPLARNPDNAALTGDEVIATRILHAPTVNSDAWSTLADSDNWAASALASGALTSAATQATLLFDAQNLDLADDDFQSQPDAEQANNTLLLVIDDEIMSIGAIAIDAQNPLRRTLTLLRGRLGTKPAAHASGAEAWLIPGSDLEALTHAVFLPGTTRAFKLLPLTPSDMLPAEDAAPIPFAFAALPPLPPLPTIAFAGVPANATAGAPFTFSLTVHSQTANLAQVTVSLIQINPNGTDGPASPVIQDTFPASLPFPQDYVRELSATALTAGSHKIAVTVSTSAGQTTAARSAAIAVAGAFAPVSCFTDTLLVSPYNGQNYNSEIARLVFTLPADGICYLYASARVAGSDGSGNVDMDLWLHIDGGTGENRHLQWDGAPALLEFSPSLRRFTAGQHTILLRSGIMGNDNTHQYLAACIHVQQVIPDIYIPTT